jgi:hypothetical protein
MSKDRTASLPGPARVTAAKWVAGGQRTWYDPAAARVLKGAA